MHTDPDWTATQAPPPWTRYKSIKKAKAACRKAKIQATSTLGQYIDGNILVAY